MPARSEQGSICMHAWRVLGRGWPQLKRPTNQPKMPRRSVMAFPPAPSWHCFPALQSSTAFQ